MSSRWKLNLDPWRTIAIIAMAAFIGAPTLPVFAQTATDQQANASDTTQSEAPALLEEDELEVLVARIALYPDDLLALVTSASLYPVDIIDAERYLEKKKSQPSLTPKTSWDGSVISLLNYPDIVQMMSDDLDWTQTLGQAIANQQKDVLDAIQQLRDEAVAKNIIKTDDKIKVVHEENNVVIQPASPEKIYVPRYEPQMLYEPEYVAAPISYYPDPYPYYYYPDAPYFTGFVTGAIWGAAVNWGYNGGIWGGNWDGNKVKIDCNKCFNNINGKVNWNDVDWKNVDRNNIKFDRNEFNRNNHRDFNDRRRDNVRNDVANRANSIRNNGNRVNNRSNRVTTNDIRASKNRVNVNNNIKVDNSRNDNRKINANNNNNRVNANNNNRNKQNNVRNNTSNKGKKNSNINRSKKNTAANRQNVNRNKANTNRNANRPAQYRDQRKRPSAYGDVRSGRKSNSYSNRGRNSMSSHRGGGRQQIRRGGGGGRRR